MASQRIDLLIACAATLLGVLALAALVWGAGSIVALFVVAFILAYLFNPLATNLSHRGVPRTLSALIITGGLVLIVCGVLAVLGPILYAQLSDMLTGLQDFFTKTLSTVGAALKPYFPVLHRIGLGGLVRQTPQPDTNVTVPVAATVIRGSMAVFTTMGLTVLTPVVTFYLLKDWPRMIGYLLHAVPPARRPMVCNLVREIDRVLWAFVHGQAWVCLCVAVICSVALMAVGLNFALVIGIATGLLKFLPYVGITVAFATAITAAVVQHGWDGWFLTSIVGIYMLIEVLDTSILSPRLIGPRVQLPPALVIFAILIGAKVFGVIGVFIAIPAFAVGRVMLSFWLRRNEPEEAPPRPSAAARPAMTPPVLPQPSQARN
jgi:predicted PurR-regulated permease PerM